ncbi:aldo/keto reductase [Agarilytica rhodophyticola]|uniref:aldo/keto reductase n=1 Tax=Agarilytica rhodophyticola TaxID=1737490 RepID=UPI000B347F09|nr:aldo/keto reductase [Agarilytica rhodophyticola]
MPKYALEEFLPNASSLVYGCMGLGGEWQESNIADSHYKQANEVIEVALEAGINVFDHADIYRLGKAEKVFGRVLKERPSLRDKMFIQSKCGIRFQDDIGPKRYDFSKQWLVQSVEGSLARLGIEQLDILLLHRPDPLMEPGEVAEAFEVLREQGKVKFFGVSNMHIHQIAYLQSYLDAPLIANQIEISLQQLAWLDEGVMAGNPKGSDLNFTSGTLEHCRKNGIQLQAWGSLCQGLFSGRDITNEPEHIQTTASMVASLADKYNVSLEALILAWLMKHPANIQPIIGTTKIDRITACSQSSSINISREDWYSLYVSARGDELP